MKGEKHLAEAFDQLVEELRSQYSLGYYLSDTIDVTRPDTRVLARKGYYAPRN